MARSQSAGFLDWRRKKGGKRCADRFKSNSIVSNAAELPVDDREYLNVTAVSDKQQAEACKSRPFSEAESESFGREEPKRERGGR